MKGFREAPDNNEGRETEVEASERLADFFKDWQVEGKMSLRPDAIYHRQDFRRFEHNAKMALSIHDQVLQKAGLSLHTINFDLREGAPGNLQVMPAVENGEALANMVIEEVAGGPFAEECRQNVETIVDYHLARAPQATLSMLSAGVVERYGHDADLNTEPTEVQPSNIRVKQFDSLQEIAANAGDLQIALYELGSSDKELDKLAVLHKAASENALLDYALASALRLTPGCKDDYEASYSPFYQFHPFNFREARVLNSLLDVRDISAPESWFTRYLYSQAHTELSISLDFASREATYIQEKSILEIKELDSFWGQDVRAKFNKKYLELIATHERCQTWLQARGLLKEDA